MTTRRNSGENYGAMRPEERRRTARRDELTSQGRYENDYETNSGNRRMYYDDERSRYGDDERDRRFGAADRTGRENYINDDEDYDNGRSERRYGNGYKADYRDRYDENFRNQDQRFNDRYPSEEGRSSYNRSDENQYSRRGFGSMGRHNYENETGYREHSWQPYSNSSRSSYPGGDRRREYDGERNMNRGYSEEQRYGNTGMGGRNYDDLNLRNSDRGWDESRDYAFGNSSEKRHTSSASKTNSNGRKSTAKTTTKRGNKK